MCVYIHIICPGVLICPEALGTLYVCAWGNIYVCSLVCMVVCIIKIIVYAVTCLLQHPVQVQNQFDGLHSAWISFQQCLIDSDAMLKKHKVSTASILSIQSVNEQCLTNRRNFVLICCVGQRSSRRPCPMLWKSLRVTDHSAIPSHVNRYDNSTASSK